MAKVFISYSVKDEPFAKRMYNALSSLGVSTFLAGISLKPGSNWTEEILNNLKLSQWVLFLASKAACQSPAVQQELGASLIQGKIIIPIIWDISAEELPGWIRRYQAVDISSGNVEALKGVISSIAEKVKSDKFIGGLIVAALVIAFIYILSKS